MTCSISSAYKRGNVNVHHCHLADLVRSLRYECPRLSSTGLHCVHPGAQIFECARFSRPQKFRCLEHVSRIYSREGSVVMTKSK